MLYFRVRVFAMSTLFSLEPLIYISKYIHGFRIYDSKYKCCLEVQLNTDKKTFNLTQIWFVMLK